MLCRFIATLLATAWISNATPIGKTALAMIGLSSLAGLDLPAGFMTARPSARNTRHHSKAPSIWGIDWLENYGDDLDPHQTFSWESERFKLKNLVDRFSFKHKDDKTTLLAKLYLRHKDYLDLPVRIAGKDATLLEYYFQVHGDEVDFGAWALEENKAMFVVEADFIADTRAAAAVFYRRAPGWEQQFMLEWKRESEEELDRIRAKAYQLLEGVVYEPPPNSLHP